MHTLILCDVNSEQLPVFLLPCSEALQVATFIRKNAKKQTTRFAGSLEIGSKLKVPVKIFTKASTAII